MATTATSHKRERVTIEEVAAAAGVSVATVSRALRGLPNVASSTRERVRGVADEMHYRADPAASQLATGRSKAIGLAVPVLSSWYFANVVAGAEAVATEAGYDTIVVGVSSREDRQRLTHDTDRIHRRIDGLILVDVSMPEPDLDTLAEQEFEVVTIGTESRLFPSVGIDDLAVGRLAAEHLIELGHTVIGLIHGQVGNPLDFVVPELRHRGFDTALAAAGIVRDHGSNQPGNFSIEGGYEAAHALLRADRRPTALFALSDEMAFGAVQAARDLGLSVPGDVSIIGVDNHDVSAVLNLTTVGQDVADHGSRAARILLDRLNGQITTMGRVVQPTRLIVRGTTGPPPRNAVTA